MEEIGLQEVWLDVADREPSAAAASLQAQNRRLCVRLLQVAFPALSVTVEEVSGGQWDPW
jgi:hypothetical protein